MLVFNFLHFHKAPTVLFVFLFYTDCVPVTKIDSLGPELMSTLTNFKEYMSKNNHFIWLSYQFH